MRDRFISYDFDPVRPAAVRPGGQLVGPPAISGHSSYEPVTVALAKQHAEYDLDDRDTLIGLMIKAARQYLESHYGLAIMPQTVTATWRGPAAELYLPRRPLVAVSSVLEITDGAGASLSAGDFYTEGTNPVRLLQTNKAYAVGKGKALRVTYTAGYSSSEANETTQQAAVPANIQMAVLMLVSTMFELRVPMVTPGVKESLPVDFAVLMDEYNDLAV